MMFECEVRLSTAIIEGEEDLQIKIMSPTLIEMHLKDVRVFNVLEMRKQIVAGLNKELDNMVEQYLGAMAQKEDIHNSEVIKEQEEERRQKGARK